MKILALGYRKLSATWWMLRLTYALLFICVGVDKFFNAMVEWHSFLTPYLSHYFSVADSFILHGFALIQMSIGFLLLTKWYRAATYAGLVTLIIIFFNLLTLNSCLVVLTHDVLMIQGMITFLVLTQIRDEIT